MAGRIPIVAVGVPACGVKGRLARLLHRKRARTKRSGSVRGSTGVGFAACVRGREAEGRWKWDERSRQRDRREGGGATGALTARGRPNWQRVFDGAKRERVGGPEAVGLREAYRIARSGGLVELPQTQAAGPRNPRCEAEGVEGTAATVRRCAAAYTGRPAGLSIAG